MEMNGAVVTAIEGNIASGKSTFAETLAAQTGARVFVDSAVNDPYLHDFLREPARFALPFQLSLLTQRVATAHAARACADAGTNAIIDQSFLSDPVFAKTQVRYGNMTDTELRIYEKRAAELRQHVPAPDVVVFIDATPGHCMKRVQKRGRKGEESMELRYLETLDKEYAAWRSTLRPMGIRLHVLPWNVPGGACAVRRGWENACARARGMPVVA